MLVVPRILAIYAFDDFKELFLCVTVARVALADVAKLDVDEVVQGSSVDILDRVDWLGRGVRGDQDLDFFGSIETLDNVLAVLASPATIATETTSCGTAPI